MDAQPITAPRPSLNGAFTLAILNALDSAVCVIDRQGMIVLVNHGWCALAAATVLPPAAYTGMNYFDVCGAAGSDSEQTEAFAVGVRSVLNGESAFFESEYLGYSSTGDRWFLARVTALPEAAGAVIEHLDIIRHKALEHQVARLTATDPLTGLPNRHYFGEYGDREVARVGRFTVPATLIAVDLDGLKQINDVHGNAAGDYALRRIAETFQAALRTVDLIGRIGGEEFGLLLPGTYESDGLGVAEKLRLEIAALTIISGNHSFTITASFGVAEVKPTDLSIADVLARADVALREAKKDGGNYARRFFRSSSILTEEFLFKEFRAFALRGNVIDLAVGVIVGTAFTGIVNSLVSDLLMPPLGFLLGGIDFSDFFLVLKGAHSDTLAAAKAAGSVVISYGVFLNVIIRFIIAAFAVFLLVRWINKIFAATKSAPAAPSKSELLLEEIRDLLKPQPKV